jgi:hypothetical protein
MVNFVETLFGLAIVAAIVALVFLLRRRRAAARKLGIAAIALAGVAGILELYLQIWA